MKLLQLFSALALSLTAVACATPAPTSLVFGPQSNTALLVSAGPPTTMATSIELRRVNMETLQFEDEIVSVVNAGLGGNQINHRSNICPSVRASIVAMSLNGEITSHCSRCAERQFLID